MAEDYIQLPVDSIGKKVRSFSNTVGPNTVHSQASTIVDTAGNTMANLDGSGRIQVNASGVAVPITDNSGSLTVDSPVGTPLFVRLSDGAAPITALPITDNSGSLTVDSPVGTPLFVRLSDGASPITALPITDNSGSLTVDAPVTTPVFTRLSDGTNPVTVTSNRLAVDPSGVTSPVQPNTSIVDNAAFTDGTSRVDLAGFIFDEVAGTALTENDAAAARIDSKRAIINVIEDATNRGVRAGVTSEGRLQVVLARPATPATTSVATSTTNATLLAANALRHGATIYNDSNSLLYVKLGATASATSFTIRMAPQSYYEVPFGYTGIIDGVLNTGTGNARVTALTA